MSKTSFFVGAGVRSQEAGVRRQKAGGRRQEARVRRRKEYSRESKGRLRGFFAQYFLHSPFIV
ncbi:hypothetical protein V0288_16015 [Pannus brasiliensis CCIBt3594]|uniref:Uncharacterized protein n=1 Tax=Pannus brasiliensis CCIBt3594 TaxID=1427578 RepID=A0AAW9QZD8_9CHRO